MKTVAIILIAALLGGCAVVSKKLDEETGTTIQERCLDYMGLLAAAEALQATDPTPERASRIVLYQSLIAAKCTAPAPSTP